MLYDGSGGEAQSGGSMAIAYDEKLRPLGYDAQLFQIFQTEVHGAAGGDDPFGADRADTGHTQQCFILCLHDLHRE